MDERRTVKARFVGYDGSLGYRRGRTYKLRVWSTDKYPVVIRRRFGGGYCPYSTQEAFERNWEVVRGWKYWGERKNG